MHEYKPLLIGVSDVARERRGIVDDRLSVHGCGTYVLRTRTFFRLFWVPLLIQPLETRKDGEGCCQGSAYDYMKFLYPWPG